MDGRRRLAEPVTDGAPVGPSAGLAPAFWRLRSRGREVRQSVLNRRLCRWLQPLQGMPRGAGIVAAGAFVLLAIVFGVVRGGHLPVIAAELGHVCDRVANTLGFRISSIALAGEHELTREQILATAGITGTTSLLFLDANAARARLKANPWIAEATVLKLYPGRLHIAVIERHAFALWQQQGKVAVIADDGTVVEQYVARRFAKLPLVVGTGAGPRAKEFLAVFDKYADLRKQMRAAVLVAERRWNIVLDNGITVRLPEEGLEQALDRLVELDRDKKLLSRDITAVDLRLPDRVTVRLSDDAYAARQEALKPKTKKKAGAA